MQEPLRQTLYLIYNQYPVYVLFSQDQSLMQRTNFKLLKLCYLHVSIFKRLSDVFTYLCAHCGIPSHDYNQCLV